MKHNALIGTLILGAILFPAALFAGGECTADIRGSLMRKESGDLNTTYVAKVDVSARETCAKIRFELIVVEMESGGEQFEVRVPKQIRVRDSSVSSMKMDYKLKKGRTVVSHRFEQTGCDLCE